MAIPTALAPTVDLATPKVERFAEKLRAYFDGKIDRFYTCDPSTMYVKNADGEEWVDGSWGLHLLVDGFQLEDVGEMQSNSETIRIDNVNVKPRSATEIELSIWLTARLMR